MTCRELTLGVMEARGISAGDPASVRTTRARVDNCAARMRKRGALVTDVVWAAVLGRAWLRSRRLRGLLFRTFRLRLGLIDQRLQFRRNRHPRYSARGPAIHVVLVLWGQLHCYPGLLHGRGYDVRLPAMQPRREQAVIPSDEEFQENLDRIQEQRKAALERQTAQLEDRMTRRKSVAGVREFEMMQRLLAGMKGRSW